MAALFLIEEGAAIHASTTQDFENG